MHTLTTSSILHSTCLFSTYLHSECCTYFGFGHNMRKFWASVGFCGSLNFANNRSSYLITNRLMWNHPLGNPLVLFQSRRCFVGTGGALPLLICSQLVVKPQLWSLSVCLRVSPGPGGMLIVWTPSDWTPNIYIAILVLIVRFSWFCGFMLLNISEVFFLLRIGLDLFK